MVLHHRAGHNGALLLEIHRPRTVSAASAVCAGRTGLYPHSGNRPAHVPALPRHGEADLGAHGALPLHPARDRGHPGHYARTGAFRRREHHRLGLHLRGRHPRGGRL